MNWDRDVQLKGPPADLCYFCKENVAAITFEPCGCKLSCFECSLSTVACGCGTPIEKRSYNESNQVKNYIQEVKRNRRLLQGTINEFVKCFYCKEEPAFAKYEPCGHMVACFLCSFRNDDCKECGNAIASISLTKTKQVSEYMDRMKNFHNKMQWDKKEAKQECAVNQYMQSFGNENVVTNTIENATEECMDEVQEPTLKKCSYCQANAATITFEPCKHVISCFECCIRQEICRECGTPIEKRSLCEDSVHLNRYVEGIGAMKGEIKEDQDIISTVTKRFDELQDCITCNICKLRPIMCALSCGHMYCVPCVKRLKENSPRVTTPRCGYCFSTLDQNNFRGPDPKCIFCPTVSKYTVLLPKFPLGL